MPGRTCCRVLRLVQMLSQLDRLRQGHSEHVRVEVDRPRHVLADERQVIDTAEFELRIFLLRHIADFLLYSRPLSIARIRWSTAVRRSGSEVGGRWHPGDIGVRQVEQGETHDGGCQWLPRLAKLRLPSLRIPSFPIV